MKRLIFLSILLLPLMTLAQEKKRVDKKINSEPARANSPKPEKIRIQPQSQGRTDKPVIQGIPEKKRVSPAIKEEEK